MSQYKSYTADQIDELASNFIIDSWSYSKVTSFARNEKAFEMSYIFNCPSRKSASSVAGNAYHAALDVYFSRKKQGETMSLPEMQAIAYDYIDEIGGNEWKLQKTTPTVEDCKIKTTAAVTALLSNFMKEVHTYEDDIAEVLEVEVRCDEYLTINGVDIPLPCHGKIDLVVRTKAGKIAVVDHKSKAKFTPDDEISLVIGIQAITYVNLYESKTGVSVDEVWFVENKDSQNKDKSPQLKAYKVEITIDTRRLYEALLYEPLRRMLTAVNDPDYVYLINDSDNFVDKAELYDFWAKTMIAEVEEFNIADDKKEMVSRRLKKIRDVSIASINPKIIKEFKANAASFIHYDLSHTNMTPQQKIEHILRSFGVIVQVAYTLEGYSSNTYLLEVSAGIRITSVQSHKMDIANALDVPNVRIPSDLVVHEGKSYLAVEFAKRKDGILYYDPAALQGYDIPVGVDNFGNVVTWDLDNHSTPHMLVCGSTGSGKSVFLRSTIEYAHQAGISNIIIFDPKHEFKTYTNNGIMVVNEIEEIEAAMQIVVDDMNDRVKRGKVEKTLVVFDEFADALANSKKGNELNIYKNVITGYTAKGTPKYKRECVGQRTSLDENLRILLQKGRSSGYRVVAATQRASVKVITGDTKVNLPVQICFRVNKEADSRVVLDEAGAESLCGMGDGLIKSPDYPNTVRFQAYYKPEKQEAVS